MKQRKTRMGYGRMGDREFGVQGTGDTILVWSGRKKQRLKGGEGVSCVYIWGKREKPVQRPRGRNVPPMLGNSKVPNVTEPRGQGRTVRYRVRSGRALEAPLNFDFYPE